MSWKKVLIGTAVIGTATVCALPYVGLYFVASAPATILAAKAATLGIAGLSEWLLLKSAKAEKTPTFQAENRAAIVHPVKVVVPPKKQNVSEIKRSRNMPSRQMTGIKPHKRVRVARDNVRIHD